MQEFLDGKSFARDVELGLDGQGEQVTMAYRGRVGEVGLSDITVEMRERLGYADGRYYLAAVDHHVDSILECVLGDGGEGDGVLGQHDVAEADLCLTERRSVRPLEQVEADVSYVNACTAEAGALYETLRSDVKNEFLEGSRCAEQSFLAYQDCLNGVLSRSAKSERERVAVGAAHVA